MTLAPDSLATIIPGVIVDGLEAVDVLHEASLEGGIRSTIWGKQASGTSRRLSALRALVDQLDPDRKFRGTWEYRVVTQGLERVNLQPVRVSSGMPDLRQVYVRPGVAGVKSMFTLGCRVVVSFLDADPLRPFVFAIEDADGSGFLPISTTIDAKTLLTIGSGAVATKLGLGVLPVARSLDVAGIYPITTSQTKVLA